MDKTLILSPSFSIFAAPLPSISSSIFAARVYSPSAAAVPCRHALPPPSPRSSSIAETGVSTPLVLRRHRLRHRDLSYIERTTIHHIPCKRYCVSYAFEHKYVPDLESEVSKGLVTDVLKMLDAFWRFSRPHTIFGTLIGITSVSFLPIETMADFSPIFFIGLLKALLAAIFMNIYVVGLNQLFDVELDKVNKPSLPLASGEFSMETGIVIVVAFCMMSVFMGLRSQSPPLLCALTIHCLLGTAYSIDHPFLRWKKHPFLAASCIICVRAIVIQIAYFLHMQRYILGRPIALTKSVVFATTFMFFFSAVIALFKDIPDADGDQSFGIQTFSVRLGQEKVFWLCIKLLLTAYSIAIIVGASSRTIYQKLAAVLGHVFLASILWFHAQHIDRRDKISVASFYMFIWKLFYAEYLLIPFIQ